VIAASLTLCPDGSQPLEPGFSPAQRLRRPSGLRASCRCSEQEWSCMPSQASRYRRSRFDRATTSAAWRIQGWRTLMQVKGLCR